MAEFANLSEVLNRLSGGAGTPESLFINKYTQSRNGGTGISLQIGKLMSAWMVDGGIPGAGVAPGAVAVPTSATAGAIPFTNASGGREKRLLAGMFSWGQSAGPTADNITDIFLYDRLLHQSNLSGTVTSAQNVQSGSGVSLTRSTTGEGNEIWLEVYTAGVGSTIQTATCSYTNQAGTAGRTTQVMPFGGSTTVAGTSIMEASRMYLQAGDTGVRSVETLTLSGSTGTAGVFGVTIAHRLGQFPIHDGISMVDFTYGDSGTPVIEDNACLALMWRPDSGTAYPIIGMLATAER